MGVMFLTLMPAPYVDASASAIVAGKWQRILISAAGMMVELAVAVFAMLVWLKAQPGLTRSIAYDTLFIASVSTLIFNGNPLLRFDAYYILSDFLELPNLGSRSQRYFLYLVQRYLFGATEFRDPATATGERFWFAVYAPASFIYRMFMLFGIALFISSKYFIVGVILAFWMGITSIVWPVLKGLKFILLSPALHHRALAIAIGHRARCDRARRGLCPGANTERDCGSRCCLGSGKVAGRGKGFRAFGKASRRAGGYRRRRR